MPTVNMPNGDAVNFPDDMPKEQIRSMISQKFPDIAKAAPASAPQAPQAPQPQPGLMQRVGQDVQKRVGQSQDIKASSDTMGEKVLQGVGMGAGLMTDVVGEAAKSAYGALPESVRKNIENDPITKMGVSMAQKGADVYGKWAQQNPRAARDVEAAVNIASLFPVPSAKLAGKAVETAVSPATNIAKGAIAPSAEKMTKITDTMHKTATATIEKAKNSGVVFHPDTGTEITSGLDKLKDLSTEGERSTRPMTVQALDDIRKSVKGGDTSLKNLLGFRDKLTEIANKGGQDGTAALNARKVLDRSIDSGKVVGGDAKAVPQVAEFRAQWGRYKTGEDVAAAANLAAESPAKSRKAFQKIVDSEYFKSLSPEVQRLTKIAAKGKASGKFLDSVGSIKNLLGASVGKHLPLLEAGGAILSGHPAVAAGIGGVMAAGKGGKLVQQGVSADVLRALQENK